MATAIYHAAKSACGFGESSTARKIIQKVDLLIQESEQVRAICTEKGWLVPTKNLNLTVRFAQKPLAAAVVILLGTKTHYVAYQEEDEKKKTSFQDAVASALATQIIKEVKAENAAGAEGWSYCARKIVVTATLTVTPLQEDAIEEAVCRAAEAAKILRL